MQDIRTWISSGAAKKRFGQHIKLVTCLNSKSSPTQVDRTVRMNYHGRRFQASIEMVQLEGLTNPNGVLNKKGPATTIRDKILALRTPDKRPIFLSITKKWNSSFWQATYISKEKVRAVDIAACSAAWLKKELSPNQHAELYKHYSPEAVTEAKGATWDNEKARIITPSERIANEEESELANISWLVDLSSLEKLDETSAVQFADGHQFDFDADASIKTTRVHDAEKVPATSKSSQPPGILRSGGTSVTSEITEATRISDLESGMASIEHKLDTTLAAVLAKLETGYPSSSTEGGGKD